MKKKIKAPAKKAKSRKLKARHRRGVAPRTPKLVITILADCTLDNNQKLHPPHVSDASDGGFPNHVQFKGDIVGWFCIPAGYLTPEPGSPLEVGPGNPSRLFKVVDPAPTTEIHFHHACDKPCVAQTLNGDVIIIDA